MVPESSITLYTPDKWSDYQLIDSGNGRKLERFGQLVADRPEPQALWSPLMPEKEWNRMTHVQFIQKGSHSGTWKKLKPSPDQWQISYPLPSGKLIFNLSLTGFKHVGVFPEQAVNWEYIFENTHQLLAYGETRVLNLFAYTGGASLAAKAAGADVTHVDSVRQVIGWSKQNMESSGLHDIRWVVEDALKFVQREARRGKLYHGIILDPPAYGIGSGGERWKLDEQIHDMLSELKSLLAPRHFFVLNMYSLGMSALITENLVQQIYQPQEAQTGEIYLMSETGQRLPLGIVSRFAQLG